MYWTKSSEFKRTIDISFSNIHYIDCFPKSYRLLSGSIAIFGTISFNPLHGKQHTYSSSFLLPTLLPDRKSMTSFR